STLHNLDTWLDRRVAGTMHCRQALWCARFGASDVETIDRAQLPGGFKAIQAPTLWPKKPNGTPVSDCSARSSRSISALMDVNGGSSRRAARPGNSTGQKSTSGGIKCRNGR